MNYQEARSILEAAEKKAAALSLPVSLAVVDAGGHLLAFARLDSVVGVGEFALRKARTATLFGVDSDIMGAIITGAGADGPGMASANGGLLTLAGGVLLRNAAGEITGAIGCSGGTPQQDKEIALAGAEASR